jgi:hypothetical protein
MKNTKEIMKSKNKAVDEEITDHNALRKHGERREKLNEAEMPLLFLVPLVETAWAHGAIARSEKQLIFTAAREEQIDEKHPLNETLDELLVYQPGQQFFDYSLSLIKSCLAAMTVKERESKRAKLIKRCREIAAAAAGNSMMDVNKSTSPEEREMLARLASELDFREDSPRGGRHANVEFFR